MASESKTDKSHRELKALGHTGSRTDMTRKYLEGLVGGARPKLSVADLQKAAGYKKTREVIIPSEGVI